MNFPSIGDLVGHDFEDIDGTGYSHRQWMSDVGECCEQVDPTFYTANLDRFQAEADAAEMGTGIPMGTPTNILWLPASHVAGEGNVLSFDSDDPDALDVIGTGLFNTVLTVLAEPDVGGSVLDGIQVQLHSNNFGYLSSQVPTLGGSAMTTVTSGTVFFDISDPDEIYATVMGIGTGTFKLVDAFTTLFVQHTAKTVFPS